MTSSRRRRGSGRAACEAAAAPVRGATDVPHLCLQHALLNCLQRPHAIGCITKHHMLTMQSPLQAPRWRLAPRVPLHPCHCRMRAHPPGIRPPSTIFPSACVLWCFWPAPEARITTGRNRARVQAAAPGEEAGRCGHVAGSQKNPTSTPSRRPVPATPCGRVAGPWCPLVPYRQGFWSPGVACNHERRPVCFRNERPLQIGS